VIADLHSLYPNLSHATIIYGLVFAITAVTFRKLAPEILSVAENHAIREEEHQAEERYRLQRELVDDETGAPEYRAPRAGFSRFKLLAIVEKDIQFAGAAAQTQQYTQLMEHLQHARYVMHECHMPQEMLASRNPNAGMLLSSSVADVSRPEEYIRASLRRQQQVAMAVVLHAALPLGVSGSVTVAKTNDHQLLECCAAALDVCSLYLLLLVKQACASPVAVIDECRQEDEAAVAATKSEKMAEKLIATVVAPTASDYDTPRLATHGSLLLVSGAVVAENGHAGNMVPSLLTRSLSYVRKPLKPLPPGLVRLCKQISTMTSARPDEYETARDWAALTAIVCGMPQVLSKSHSRVLGEGALSFFSGLTIGEGFSGGCAVATTILCFIGLRTM
jgi:hypothetical protein